jgi:hypothetical protein
VNKPENDEILAQKADLVDIQRVLSSLDSKAETSQFQGVIRGIESRMDRFDLYQSQKGGLNPEIESKVLKMMSEVNEISKKLESLDHQIV